MKAVHALAERIRRGEPIPLPIAALLTAATPFQRFGMWRRLNGPRVRLKGPRPGLKARVISFGNLTAGGTGKTPAVIERARAETAAGKRVAVLTRGYGRKWVPAETLADEPALIARLVPGVTIMQSADRVAAGRKAIEDYGCDTLILDDGFQYVRLERDENVLLVDATNPFGTGRLVPRGILREPVESAARATHLVVTRCDQAAALDFLLATLKRLCPGAPIRLTRHAPARLWRVSSQAGLPLEALRGQEVTALCGIANPESFFATLEGLGVVVRERRAFPDHAAIPDDALPRSGVIVTTEKDAVRLQDARHVGGVQDNVLALGIELQDFTRPEP